MNNNRHTAHHRLRGWAALFALTSPALACAAGAPEAAVPWWLWPLALFGVCFVLGMIAVPAGIGGGVLFVPIVSGFFPFHLDFVRGAGLLVALASALAAGPGLLRGGLADLRLALPLTLLASVGAIIGALVGLALPTAVVEVALGITILCIAVLMWSAKRSEFPDVTRPDSLGVALRICGVFHDAQSGRDVDWRVHRTPLGIGLFAGVGVLAGVFGLGAGWANVPVLNLVMGVPLKVSAGTSGFILSIVDSAAAWVYINKGALLAIIAVPSVIGIMLGAFIGARLLRVLRASAIRRLVIAMLLLAGARALMKGMGWWT
ncbi:MAG: hypothetical protein A3I02_16705 [Betaproteobacteria bacterium RIFCSPLOWO2_02_FULL_67_26]|nr:MAG: hypothetical protein A3I02_16705 [Betaproteobacteria bacterium RIFCSPLOWO2_02_FULL_67_26]